MDSCATGSAWKRTIHGNTMSNSFDLIQFNLGLLRYPRVAPELKSYEQTMDAVMPVARTWPGFLWIMDDDIVDLTAERFGPQYASNLSGWRDLDSLNAFMVCPIHAAAMDRRDEWFTPLEEATVVLWWEPAGTRPGFEEACRRLDLLRENGPTQDAFEFETAFSSPN